MTPPALRATSPAKLGRKVVSGLGPSDFQDPGPHLVLPAGIAGDGKNDLAVLGEDEAWRRIGARLALVAVEESRPDPQRIGGPVLFLQHQCLVGGMDDAIVELFAGIRLDEVGLRLGTPDLAAASQLVTDEYQHRLPRLGVRGASQ